MVAVLQGAIASTTMIAPLFVKITWSRPVRFVTVIAKRVAKIIILVPMTPPQETLPLVIFNVSILLFYPARMRMDAAPMDVILS